MTSPSSSAIVYTDGSCHTQRKIGAWVAIVFVLGKKVLLSGIERDTTNNRMELTAVIEAMDYIKKLAVEIEEVSMNTDSQYVAGLMGRQEKLTLNGFKNSTGEEMTNGELVKSFFKCLGNLTVGFVKVKAHQKKGSTENYNIEADI
eukprot:gene48828-65475_t